MTGAVPALVLLSLVWGYNWVVMKDSLHDAGPFTFGALRMGLGALVLVAALAGLRKPVRLRAPFSVLILGLLQTTAFTSLSNLAVANGGAGKTAVLVYTMPFWTAVLAWLFLGERLGGLQRLALVAAFAGLACVLFPLDLGHGLPSKLYATLAGLFWAGSVVYAKHLRARVEIDVASLTTWQMLFGAVPLLAFVALSHEPAPHWTANLIFGVAYNAVLATALCWLLWLYVVGKLSAGVAGIASLATPIVGVVSAWLQLGEAPSGNELVGIVLIVAALTALVLQSRSDGHRPERQVSPLASARDA